MMRGQLLTLWKQALTTFSCKKDEFSQNIELLKNLLNKMTLDDVKINPILLDYPIWEKPNKAPATYVDIYQDDNVTLGVFILKPGMTLPLHDHPGMHGLIKVIFGKLKITSYTESTESTRELKPENYKEVPNYSKPYLIAEKSSEIIADSTNNCCILYPDQKNLHEVESIDGPAAFMDILSPPYETLNEKGEIRKCSYYRVLNELAPNIYKLEKISSPSYFWTDSASLLEQ